MKHRLISGALATMVALALSVGYGGGANAGTVDDGTIYNAGNPNAVAGRYLVVFKDQGQIGVQAVSTRAADLVRAHGGSVRHTYGAALNGFSATMNEGQAKAMSRHSAVAYVEQVQRMSIQDTQNNPPNWGDDRVDQRNLPLNQTFNYPANPGQGATVYVLDTGINASHQEFIGRVQAGKDFVDNDDNPADCHGHGTHVAGTAVGTTYGIAKKAKVAAARVLNCQGFGNDDDFIAAINWVKANAQKPAVVNYSIGCGSPCSSPTLDSAVQSLIDSGVQWVQAAGNSNQDACGFSPQKVPAAITVGNTTSADAKNSTSSWGSCLDIFAPGTSIVSASYSSNTGSATMTGTSMASPHVAGAAAVYLGQNPDATPQQVRNALVNNGTTGKVTNPGSGSPNVLLYTAFMNGGGGGCTPVQVVGNSGFESGSSPWSATANVIGSWSQQAAHGGTRYAWLNGTGGTHTDTVSQSVTIPSGCTTATLRFWLHIDTAETENVVYDKLTLTMGSSTLATYSNLNKAAGYLEKAFDVKQFAGQTVTLKFTGVEDGSLQTSFVVDDVTISAA